ncbi:MAG: hypothetical protein ACREM3_08210 [Candidatus Rokuibacteriota bacterium]
MALAGPFQALAQQPAPSQAPQPQPSQMQQPEQPQRAPSRGSDAYDFGAGAMTVVGMPLKAGVCVIGGVFATALFIATLGSADYATAAVVKEGCGQRWIVRGDDIRPEGSRRDRMRDRYDGDLR